VIALDTNILVRFITRDDPVQTRHADHLLETAGDIFLLLDVVLIELFWTLRRLYAFSNEEVIEVLEAFSSRMDIEFEERNRFERALALSKKGHDFADILIIEMARHGDATAFATFDKNLVKLEPQFIVHPKDPSIE
jgi:predicted nucleic-acid-binding protein